MGKACRLQGIARTKVTVRKELEEFMGEQWDWRRD